MTEHFIVTRNLSKEGYLLSEKEIRDILDELLAMASVDNMELISTFRTENHVLFLIFKNKEK